MVLAVSLLALGGVAHGAVRADTVNVSRSPGPSTEPAVVVAGDGSALAVWVEGDDLAYSRETGGTWSTPAVVPAASGSEPRLAAAAGSAVDLVWSGFSELDGNFEVYHSRWSGSRWSLPVNVSSSVGESLEPTIAVHPSRGRLVVWSELDDTGRAALYAASSPDGESWSTGPLAGVEGDDPRLAAGTGTTAWHLAWRASPDGSAPAALLYAQRPATGNWSLPEIVSGDGEPAVDALDLAAKGSNEALVTWRAGNSLRVARRGAADWTAWPLVTDAAGLGAPAIAAAPDGSAGIVFTQAGDVRLGTLGGSAAPSVRTLDTLSGGARHAAVAGLDAFSVVLAEGGPPTLAEIYSVPSHAAPTATGTSIAPTATVTPSPSPSPSQTRLATSDTPGPAPTGTATAPGVTPKPSQTAQGGDPQQIFLPFAFRPRR